VCVCVCASMRVSENADNLATTRRDGGREGWREGRREGRRKEGRKGVREW